MEEAVKHGEVSVEEHEYIYSIPKDSDAPEPIKPRVEEIEQEGAYKYSVDVKPLSVLWDPSRSRYFLTSPKIMSNSNVQI